MKKPAKKKKKKGTRKKNPATAAAKAPVKAEKGRKTKEKDEKEQILQPVPKKQVPKKEIEKKKEPEKKKEEKESPFKFITVSLQFLREAKFELKKVKWPTRKELLASTAMVIVLVLIVAFYLGIVDFGLMKIIAVLVG
jgi:preprotein translocase subunit SecE